MNSPIRHWGVKHQSLGIAAIHKLNARQEIKILELLTKLPWGEAKINQSEFSDSNFLSKFVN